MKRFALFCLLFLLLSLLACNSPLKASAIGTSTSEPPLPPATFTPSATFGQGAPSSSTTLLPNSQQSVAPPAPALPYQNRFYRTEHSYVFEFQDARSTLRYLSALRVAWQVQIDRQTLSYAYRFSLHGKTLRLEVSSPSAALGAFTLDRFEETPGARIVTIPYLPSFNVLLYRSHFVSAYVDW